MGNDELRSLRERLESLETSSAFQERTLGRLDDVVRAFALRVERLEAEFVRLRASKGEEPLGPQDDRPPHY